MKVLLKTYYCIKCKAFFQKRTFSYHADCPYCGSSQTTYQGEEEIETK